MNDINSNDYSAYRLRLTKETIPEVEKHIESDFWNTTINRMYYACFYAAGALLVSRNTETYSHSGTRLQFGQHFIKTELINKKIIQFYHSTMSNK